MISTIDRDVIVAGGSLSGLFAAREIASMGHDVLVLEDDLEIGMPEKCDGLVSSKALVALGILPSRKIIQNEIRRAILHSPCGSSIEIDTGQQNIFVLNRKEFDRELARISVKYGAEIKVGTKIEEIVQCDEFVKVRFNNDQVNKSRVVIDSTGFRSIARSNKRGILQAAKYEVQGLPIEKDTVELYFNQQISPGFFRWIIPKDEYTAKVGVAGYGINSFKILDNFVSEMGGKVVKKIAAPVIVSGIIKRFVNKRIVTVGDAAGQTKPTTGGGIYTGGVAGILAGAAAVKALEENDLKELEKYECKWRDMFRSEFRRMILARRVFERMGDDHIDKIIEVLGKIGLTKQITEDGDFDFHSLSFLKAMGIKDILEITGAVATSDLREIISNIKNRTFR